MSNRASSFSFSTLLLATLAFSFFLTLLPGSDSLRLWRPNMVALTLIFWLIRTPERIGMGFAWIMGLLYDGTTGCYLGQHALAFTFMAYLVLILRQRVRLFGLLQQTGLVFLLLLLDQMADSWFATVIRGDDTPVNFFLGAAVGALCWPVMIRWLDRYQR